MNPIRPATSEEVEKLKKTSDLTPTSIVLAMDGENGTDFAVVRMVTELDPVYFAEGSSTARRALFIWGLENMLRFQGSGAYYFNVAVDDEPWQKAVTKWGAEQVSTGPEFRFKKVL